MYKKISIESKEYYVNELKSDECYCGRQKDRGRSFCYRCYMALPKDIKRELWKKIGYGYEEGYEEACKFLEEEVL